MKKFFIQALLLALTLSPSALVAQSHTLLTTFTNPTPALNDDFGVSVADFGKDRVIIGSDGGGAAYLCRLDGSLLTTFTISDPAAGGFGNPAVPVGDCALISAFSYGTTGQNGRAYLFNTNGTLVTTFTNPNPARVQAFGTGLAALGNDRLIISGVSDLNIGAPYLGAAYLFQTNGTLLRTFTNPAPTLYNNRFGVSVAIIGTDWVLVGAPGHNAGAPGAGVVYLFNTNGTLLNTITNPVPVADDNFGWSVAAVGSNRVLIGALDYGAVAKGGAAYLFDTDGTLLTTFTNPTPQVDNNFGWSVAGVGSNRVLIGAHQDGTGAFRAGAAYLFSTNGDLLNTFTNPTPAVADLFGWSVAAVGKDQVLIGALFDDAGARDAGAAYLFDLPYPPLSIARDGAAVSLKWTTPETGLGLQQADSLGTPMVWSNVPEAVSTNSSTNVVLQTIAGASTNRFYRLRRP